MHVTKITHQLHDEYFLSEEPIQLFDWYELERIEIVCLTNNKSTGLVVIDQSNNWKMNFELTWSLLLTWLYGNVPVISS